MAAVAQNWPRISMGSPAVAHGPSAFQPKLARTATVSCLAVSMPYEGRQGGNETGTVPAAAVCILPVDI